MRVQLSEEELGEILCGKMSESKELKEDLAHYNRQPEGHPDRSYKYLHESMQRNIHLIQMRRSRAADAAAIKAGNLGDNKAIPALGDPNVPSPKAIKKAAAKAKALAASTDALVLAAFEGQGQGQE
eukprot:9976279-Heterocapsa_arctica.AAC.1